MFNRRLLIAKYEITVQDDRFLPILEDTVFHANVDYLISLDLI